MSPRPVRVAVLGAGNAGHAMAADLSLGGADVRLYELPEFARALAPVQERRGIELTGIGRTGFARVRATSDLAEALAGGDVVFVALAHERLGFGAVPGAEIRRAVNAGQVA